MATPTSPKPSRQQQELLLFDTQACHGRLLQESGIVEAVESTADPEQHSPGDFTRYAVGVTLPTSSYGYTLLGLVTFESYLITPREIEGWQVGRSTRFTGLAEIEGSAIIPGELIPIRLYNEAEADPTAPWDEQYPEDAPYKVLDREQLQLLGILGLSILEKYGDGLLPDLSDIMFSELKPSPYSPYAN